MIFGKCFKLKTQFILVAVLQSKTYENDLIGKFIYPQQFTTHKITFLSYLTSTKLNSTRIVIVFNCF